MPDPARADPAIPVPAATVIPLRDGPGGLEALMLRRNSRGQFGGMWVFPGGQVDAADAPADSSDETPEVAAARQAAVREAREEAAIELEAETLVVLSFWLPPRGAPRRFATWFFLAPTHGRHEVTVDQAEIHEHRWMTPREAIELRQRGEIELAPPTFTTLWWLGSFSDAQAALDSARGSTPERYETRIAFTPDGQVMATLWAGDAGYEDGDMERPGRRRRLVMAEGAWRVEIDP